MENKEKPFNQSAFPIGKQIQSCDQGMTLRDYFANSAMQGLLSNHCIVDDVNTKSVEYISAKAYLIADEMLIERNR